MSGVTKFIKSSLLYSTLGFLPFASRIVLMPLYLLRLSPDEFAKISLNTTIASALGIFMTLGFDTAFARYYFDYKNNKKVLSSYFSTVLISIFLIGIVMTLLIIPFGNSLHHYFFKSQEFTFYPFGITALFIALIGSVNGCILVFYRNEQKPLQYFYFAGGLFIFSTLAEFIAIVLFKLNADGIILFKLTFTALYSILFWFAIFKKIGFSFEIRFLKSLLSYSIPLIPYMFFGFIYTSYDRIMIENYLDLNSLAVYNLAFAIVAITETIMVALQNTIFPTIYGLLKSGYDLNKEKINNQIKAFLLILILTMASMLSVVPFGISQYLPPIYRLAIFLIPLLFIGIIMRFLYVIYTIPLFYLKETKKLPWLNIIAGIAIVAFNLILLPKYGLYGAAISMILARILQIILAYYWYIKTSKIRFKLGYANYVLFPLIIYFAALPLVSSITNKYSSVISYAIPITFIAIFFTLKFTFIVIKNKGNKSIKSNIIIFLNGTSNN